MNDLLRAVTDLGPHGQHHALMLIAVRVAVDGKTLDAEKLAVIVNEARSVL